MDSLPAEPGGKVDNKCYIGNIVSWCTYYSLDPFINLIFLVLRFILKLFHLKSLLLSFLNSEIILFRYWNEEVKVSCVFPTLWDLMDCSPPGSSVHGNFQARILEWVASPFSRVYAQSRAWTQVSCISRQILHVKRFQNESFTSPHAQLHSDAILRGQKQEMAFLLNSRP